MLNTSDWKSFTKTREQDIALEALWAYLEDLPMDPETERMEVSFLHFPEGTHREEIWKWFDERYSKGVYHLMFSDGTDRTADIAKLMYVKGICPECENDFCLFNTRGWCRLPMVKERRPKLKESGVCDDCTEIHQWSMYQLFLVRWAIAHSGEEWVGFSPPTYEQFLRHETKEAKNGTKD